MDINQVENILKNHKYDNCYCAGQKELEMMKRITGETHFLNYIGFLLNVVNLIENDKEMLMEKTTSELIEENKKLVEKVKNFESLIATYNGSYIQRIKLKNGKKIAYKENVTAEEIIKLKKAGLSDKEIAERIGASQSTIWRRRKEYKE